MQTIVLKEHDRLSTVGNAPLSVRPNNYIEGGGEMIRRALGEAPHSESRTRTPQWVMTDNKTKLIVGPINQTAKKPVMEHE